MPEPEPTPPTPEPEPTPPTPEPEPTPEPVEVEPHKEETIVTWTQEEKEKLFNSISQIGEFINGKKTQEPEPPPAAEPEAKPKRRGLRYKRK